MTGAWDVVRVADHEPVPRVVDGGSVVSLVLVERVGPAQVTETPKPTAPKASIFEAGAVIHGVRPRIDHARLQAMGQTLVEGRLEGVVI